jgi:two-component system chemotaxis response regulator CheB
MPNNVRTVLADDSPFLREVLMDLLVSRGIEVAGCARNGKEAIQLVKELRPDVLVLDCEMPVMNGLEALKIIMEECPLPVFIFSSLSREGGAVTIKALELGAVDFLLKPLGGAHNMEAVADELISKIRLIAMKNKFGAYKRREPVSREDLSKSNLDGIAKRRVDIIAIGSSTGGVQAASEVLPKLPAEMKPIVWVQHMPPNFTKSFAERLDSMSKMHVVEAKNGDTLVDGTCYIAPGGFQMQVVKSASCARLRVEGTDKVSGHCPSCNVLFDSVSQNYAENSVGVIMTGMGDDGAQGLAKMHQRGAFVIGQNERTCVVYGMPKSAATLGAVNIEVNLTDIPRAIEKVTGIGGA